MIYRLFILLGFAIIIILTASKSNGQECTDKVCSLPEYHDVEAWSAGPNRTVNITINGEIGVYHALHIEPCSDATTEGWVLHTDDENPWCYTIGERIGTMVMGRFVPFIEKTYPF